MDQRLLKTCIIGNSNKGFEIISHRLHTEDKLKTPYTYIVGPFYTWYLYTKHKNYQSMYLDITALAQRERERDRPNAHSVNQIGWNKNKILPYDDLLNTVVLLNLCFYI